MPVGLIKICRKTVTPVICNHYQGNTGYCVCVVNFLELAIALQLNPGDCLYEHRSLSRTMDQLVNQLMKASR